MLKLLSATAIALTLAIPAWAQTSMSGTTDASQVIGKELRARNGEQIGTVRDVLMGPNEQITGIIVDTGRGMTQKGDIAFDWSDVSVEPQDRSLVVDVSPEMLQPVSPGYSAEPSMTGTMGTPQEAVPDISESQPGTIGGRDVEEETPTGLMGGGSTDETSTGQDGGMNGNSSQ